VVKDVTCLDAHLLGHAFKYRGSGQNIAGVYPYRIAYAAKDGAVRSVDVRVKGKPDEADTVSRLHRTAETLRSRFLRFPRRA